VTAEANQQGRKAIKWGPFRFRVPFYHTRVEWPDLIQGLIIAGATGLALVPLLQSSFGLSFEQAVTISFIHSLLISSSPILFGEPFAAGWVTPALPLVLVFVLGETFSTPEQRFQAMTAMSLELAALVFLLGVSRLGSRFVSLIPNELRAGIIMGAALAAFKRVFFDDLELLRDHPISLPVAMFVCLMFAFSPVFARLKQRSKALGLLASLGLLPGFLIAGLLGPLVGEISYTDIQWGFMVPEFAAVFDKVSPFAIGWPSLDIFVTCLPLALIGYIILFGDIITGVEILKDGADVNVDRIHLSIGIRNFLMAIFAPFFPTQGVLWTGVQVVIVERWRQGKEAMQSLHSGITSYYVFGLPVLYLFLPLTTTLKPLLPIALALTLIMTGFACAYVAMSMVREKSEQGACMLIGMALIFFDPWIGLLIGIAAAIGLTEFRQPKKTTETSNQKDDS